VPGPERSLWWWNYNTGKLSVTADLDSDAGAARFRRLVASSDIVLEGEVPGRLADLRLDHGEFACDRPGLVWVSVTPFGRTGSRVAESVTDLTILAGAGPAWSCGYDDHRLPPVRPGGNQGYHTASLWAVIGAMTALYAQRTLGFGQFVDVSMHAASNVTTEAGTYEWLVAQATVQRQTFRHAAVSATPPRLMHSSDGGHVIGALPRHAAEYQAVVEWMEELGIADQMEEFFFLGLGAARGGVLVPEIGSDPEVAAIYQAGGEALRLVAEHVGAREFFLGAQRRGIPAGMLLAPEDVLADEHFVARGFPVEVHHEDLQRTFLYPGAPFRATASPWRVRGRAPHCGEHSDIVLDALGEGPE
jgi:crotonobetainyl-CoA:carnitine CoA-transferase CaiB-like acyl-CoA transferase